MKALTIASLAPKLLIRDRTTIFFTVLLPFVIILIIGTATAGFDENKFPLGVVNNDDGAFADELVDGLGASGTIAVSDFSDATELRRAIRRGVVGAGVVISDGYDTSLRKGKDVEVEFLSDTGRGFPALLRSGVSAAVADQGAFIQAASFAAEETGGSFDDHLAEAKRVAEISNEVGVERDELGDRPRSRFIMSGFEYTAPSNLILFVFITSVAGSSLLIAVRRLGVAERMLATPTRASTIVLGQTLGMFAVSGFQAIYIVVIGTLVFGVDWGDPAGALALTALFAAVGTSFGVLFGTIFRTPEQAGSIGPPVGIAMGMLSGCMWPRFIMPELMQRIGQAFPHSWAMDGFITLIARGGAVADILPQLAVLAAFVAVILPLATWRLRRFIAAGA